MEEVEYPRAEEEGKMFKRCLFCRREFRKNRSLGHLRLGRRFAFDPVRGRLWVICEECHRWNLYPVEDRGEALYELERTNGKRALITMCIGGGQGIALAIERL